MNWVHHPTVVPGVEAWQAVVGGWNFFISHPYERHGLYYCSVDLGWSRIIFFNEEEVNISPASIYEVSVPHNFGYQTLREAKEGCEAKYKKLLLR